MGDKSNNIENILNNDVSCITSANLKEKVAFGDGNVVGFNILDALIGSTVTRATGSDFIGNNMWEGGIGPETSKHSIGVNHDEDNMNGVAGLAFK